MKTFYNSNGKSIKLIEGGVGDASLESFVVSSEGFVSCFLLRWIIIIVVPTGNAITATTTDSGW